MNRDMCHLMAQKIQQVKIPKVIFDGRFDSYDAQYDDKTDSYTYHIGPAAPVIAAHYGFATADELIEWLDRLDVEDTVCNILAIREGTLMIPDRQIDTSAITLEDCVLVLRHAAKTGEIKWDITGKMRNTASSKKR